MYYVIHGRRTVLLLVLLLVIGVTFWISFCSNPRNPSNDLEFDTVFDDADEFQLSSEPVVEVLAGGIQRTVSELDQNVMVSVASVPTKFAEYRIEREKVRSRRLEQLENTINDAALSEQYRQDMQKELLHLLDNVTKETEIENLLKANGYLDAVTLIENESATIVVPVTLTREEAMVIGDLVHRITGIRLERITIVDELTRS